MRHTYGDNGFKVVRRRVAREENELVVLQSIEFQRSRFSSRMVRGQAGHERLGMKSESVQFGGCVCAEHETEVDLVAFDRCNLFDRIELRQHKIDAGILLPEEIYDLRQAPVDHRSAEADP